MTGVWRLLTCVVLISFACEADIPNDTFVCDPEECPPGFECVDGFCLRGDAGRRDGGADANVDAPERDADLDAIDNDGSLDTLDVGIDANCECDEGDICVGEECCRALSSIAGNDQTICAITTSDELGDAHRQGIIHRDVKPDNLFIVRDTSGEESVRVLDFGIAKITHDKDLTHAGVFLGTPHYCAPEQLRAKEPAPSMDVYALGSTAFEMLTGEAPFADGDLHTFIRRKTEGEAPDTTPLASLPAEVRDTILRAIAFDPEARFRDMAELEESLATWTAPRRRSVWPIATALVVVVAASVAALVLTSDPSESETRPVVEPISQPTMVTPSVQPEMREPPPPAQVEATNQEAPPAMTMRARMTMRRVTMREPESMSTPSTMSTMDDDWLDWESQ